MFAMSETTNISELTKTSKLKILANLSLVILLVHVFFGGLAFVFLDGTGLTIESLTKGLRVAVLSFFYNLVQMFFEVRVLLGRNRKLLRLRKMERLALHGYQIFWRNQGSL
jgi:archaellum biogenesis protein FlaJ (TadC family)